MLSRNPTNDQLLELARDLCEAIEGGDLTGEEALKVLGGLRVLLSFLTIPPRNRQH
jgi:hypothetical protein